MAKTATLNVKIADREEVKAAIKALTDEVYALRSVVKRIHETFVDVLEIYEPSGLTGEPYADGWGFTDHQRKVIERALGNQEEYDRG